MLTLLALKNTYMYLKYLHTEWIPRSGNGLLYFQLIPLFVCTGVGMIGAFGYLFRLATRNPDTRFVFTTFAPVIGKDDC